MPKSEAAFLTRANGWPWPGELWRRSGLGDLKFKSDPWPGREPAAGREGQRAQEASAFKGPAPSTRGSAPTFVLSAWDGGKPRLLGVT